MRLGTRGRACHAATASSLRIAGLGASLGLLRCSAGTVLPAGAATGWPLLAAGGGAGADLLLALGSAAADLEVGLLLLLLEDELVLLLDDLTTSPDTA